MRIESIGNGFLLIFPNGMLETARFYPTLSAIEADVQKAAAPAAESNTGAAPTNAAQGTAAPVVVNIADAAKKRGRPAKNVSQPETPGSGGAAPDSGQAAAAASIPKREEVQQVMSNLIATHGLPLMKDALSRFGAKRFGDLKPEQYAEFIVVVNEAIKSGKV